jgi:TATA-binding protein-associated factor
MDSLAIDGNMSFEKRERVLTEFCKPGGPRILIISKIGSAGLNLSIADVVIFFVNVLFIVS